MNSFGTQTSAISQTTRTNLPVEPATSKSVDLTIIPDWGGDTYDAFVLPSYANGTAPPLGTEGPPPNNNVTVPFGVPVTFMITNLDTAVIENYTGHASLDFAFYNATDNGQVASHYAQGAVISSLQIGHTFSIPSLNLDVPIPPDTIVAFTYTFTTPGTYEYLCETPCGAGMGVVGYMNGYVIVS
jgi:hypothetical protein